MIKIICIGKIKEKYLQDAIDEYKKRISKYTKIDIIELNDVDMNNDIEKEKKVEGESILRHIDSKDYVITLEIDGKKLDSVSLANYLDELNNSYSDIDFVIGGSNGLSLDVIERSNYHLSFSNLTFPHQLFRVMLLEQIYRTYKIRNNEKYHK